MDNSIIQRIRSFKEWFRDYGDNYVIIGGTACSMIMSEEEVDFRMTKDVDIVLLVESLSADFGSRFWDYILEAEYIHRQRSTGKSQFYRFYGPKSKEYPEMIELFSRRIDGLILPENAMITPVPIGDDISSLSAILLNDEYYSFLQGGIRRIDGIPILDELHIIPFKAKAWLDLSQRKSSGERIDSNDIRKHRRDIYRIVDLVEGGFQFSLPETVENDLCIFIDAVSELVQNIPQKEQKAEKIRIKRIITFYGLTVK